MGNVKTSDEIDWEFAVGFKTNQFSLSIWIFLPGWSHSVTEGAWSQHLHRPNLIVQNHHCLLHIQVWSYKEAEEEDDNKVNWRGLYCVPPRCLGVQEFNNQESDDIFKTILLKIHMWLQRGNLWRESHLSCNMLIKLCCVYSFWQLKWFLPVESTLFGRRGEVGDEWELGFLGGKNFSLELDGMHKQLINRNLSYIELEDQKGELSCPWNNSRAEQKEARLLFLPGKDSARKSHGLCWP